MLYLPVIKDVMTGKRTSLAPTSNPASSALLPAVDPELPRLSPVLIERSRRRKARILELFTAQIRNPNTRASYWRAVDRFGQWCEAQGLTLSALTPPLAAAYIETLMLECSPQTVKQQLAALRRLCDWLVTGGTLEFNPFASVKGPTHVVRKGKTPVLFEKEARDLLNSIDTTELIGLRDRAILATMIYSFARVSAVVSLRVKDFRIMGARATLSLQEKGGKHNQVPCTHKLAEAIHTYLEASGIENKRTSPLFRSIPRRSQDVSDKGLARQDVLAMIKRRATAAGLSEDICAHSFRATGITNYLAHGGTLETAAAIAGHASTRTTQLYDRNSDEVSQGELERIRI